MNPARFHELTARYSQLRIAVVGDVCLDRYLIIDPDRPETSVETGLPVHNVASVRSQAGAAGTIVNNLVALGIGRISVVGFCGKDGEGYELLRALRGLRGVNLEHFVETPHRRTFTYTKPMLAGRELSRLDLKNWTPTPPEVEKKIIGAIRALADEVDAFIVMDQVDVAETGVVTAAVREAIGEIARAKSTLPILADSRRSLRDWPPVTMKMNGKELGLLLRRDLADLSQVPDAAAALATQTGRPVFITLAEHGMVGATPESATHLAPALPVRGEIDIVGAGDAVSANLCAALAAGAEVQEALELANAAASVVIHQLGTTGVATVGDLAGLVG